MKSCRLGMMWGDRMMMTEFLFLDQLTLNTAHILDLFGMKNSTSDLSYFSTSECLTSLWEMWTVAPVWGTPKPEEVA